MAFCQSTTPARGRDPVAAAGGAALEPAVPPPCAPRRAIGLGRALAAFGDLRAGDYVVHDDHGVGRFVRFDTQGGGRRRPRLPVPRVPRRRPSLRAPRPAGQGQPLRRLGRLRADAGEARRQGLAARSRRGRGSRCASWPASCWRCTPGARRPAGRRSPVTTSGWRGWRRRSRIEETDDQQRAIDAVTEDMEGEPADGPAGLRRRRLRQDRGGGAGGVQGARRPAARCWCWCRRRCSPSSTRATFRDRFRDFPVEVEMVSRFRPPAEVKQVLARVSGGQGGRADRHPPRALARRRAAATWGWWWSTRSSASASPRRSCCGSCGWRSTCWRCRPRRSRARCTCRSRACATSSVITTPPRGRHPIKTHVGEFDEELIAAALRREARARGPVVLPAQPGRDDRRGGRAGAPVGAGAARRRRSRPDARAAARGA